MQDGLRADVRLDRGAPARRGRHLLPHRLQRAGRAARASPTTSTSRACSRASTTSPTAVGLPTTPAGAAARLRRRLPVDPASRAAARRGVGRRRRHLVGHVLERAGPRRRRRRGVEPAAPRRGPADGVRHRQAAPTSTARSSRSPTTCGRCRCRSRAGCPATTARSAPTASASPTPARPPAASSTSTRESVVVQALQALADAGEIDRGEVVVKAFDEYRIDDPTAVARRQAGGRRRLTPARRSRPGAVERARRECSATGSGRTPGRATSRARGAADVVDAVGSARRRRARPARAVAGAAAPRLVGRGLVERMKSCTILTNRCGWSLCGKWPGVRDHLDPRAGGERGGVARRGGPGSPVVACPR